jgi:Fe-S-cluster containining protein
MDGEFIADMLIPLSPKEAKDRIRDSGGKIGLKEEFAWKNRGHHFTCKHWDKDSKQCTAYERRPNMCRKYPYGTKCHKCGIVAGVPLGD